MKKIVALVLSVLMTAAIFAGCAPKNPAVTEPDSTQKTESVTTDNSEKTPADSEPAEKKTFTIAIPISPVTVPASEQWIWQEYEKKTGIHIDWLEIPGSAVGERKNLMMLGEDKPDAFFQIGFSASELSNYGSQGTLVNMNDYPDAWPNLKALLTDYVKGGLGAITMADGGIYGFPCISCTYEDPWSQSARMWLPKEWLKNANLEMPTTVDELTHVLEVFKAEDVNGNGDPNDEYPVYGSPGFLPMLEQELTGAFGIGKHGLMALNDWYILEDDGSLSFLYTSEGQKMIWQTFADWWEKGLMHPDTFNGYEYTQWTTDGTKDIVGLFPWVTPDYLYAGALKDYDCPLNLSSSVWKGNMAWIYYPVSILNLFSITDACEDPEALISWVDYWFSDEGSSFVMYGTEGETYNVDESGHKVYVDEIINYKAGGQLGSYQKGLFTYGCFPFRTCPAVDFTYAVGLGDDVAYIEQYNQDIKPYMPESFLPAMLASSDEEAMDLVGYSTDIAVFIGEARMKFVTGEWNFEEDWDAYVKQLDVMGVDEFMKIRQAQVDRYLAGLE